MRQYLSLTSEQTEAVRTLHTAHSEAAKPIRNKIKALRLEMREAWNVDSPNEGAIMELHREIQALAGQVSELRIQLRIDTMAILTPEQRRLMGTGRGRGFGGGPGMGRGVVGPGCRGRDPRDGADVDDVEF